MARSSAGRKHLMEEGRQVGRSLTKRMESTGPRIDPCGTPQWSQKERFL